MKTITKILSKEKVEEILESLEKHKLMEKILLPDIKDFHLIDVYVSNGGYNAAKKAFTQTPDDIIDQVKKSGLRGRGGAAFLCGLKWSFMPKTTDKPKYLCVNGDESEPGSFKDRQIFEFNPHQMIEGSDNYLLCNWGEDCLRLYQR